MLKIYSQNVWGGQVFGPLCERIAHLRDQIHLFCFQEVPASPDGVQPYTSVRTNLLAELQHRLPEYQALFCNIQSGFDPHGPITYAVDFGQAVFVHPSLTLQDHFKRFIFRTENALSAHSNTPVGWGWVEPSKWSPFAKIRRPISLVMFMGSGIRAGKATFQSVLSSPLILLRLWRQRAHRRKSLWVI